MEACVSLPGLMSASSVLVFWVDIVVCLSSVHSAVYPPKGRLLADSKGVHLFLLMFYFVLGNVYLTFKKADGICGF